MENNKNLFIEIRKKELNNNINKLSQDIRKKTEEQTILLEYKQYKNNIHIVIGIIGFFCMNFITEKIFSMGLLNSIIIATATATISSISTKSYFTKKIKRLKRENPDIDFENYDIDKNYKIIEELFEKRFLNLEELGSINQEYKNSLRQNERQEIIEEMNDKEQEQQKIKVMTLVRKK